MNSKSQSPPSGGKYERCISSLSASNGLLRFVVLSILAFVVLAGLVMPSVLYVAVVLVIVMPVIAAVDSHGSSQLALFVHIRRQR